MTRVGPRWDSFANLWDFGLIHAGQIVWHVLTIGCVVTWAGQIGPPGLSGRPNAFTSREVLERFERNAAPPRSSRSSYDEAERLLRVREPVGRSDHIPDLLDLRPIETGQANA